jgi:hypothetical protein
MTKRSGPPTIGFTITRGSILYAQPILFCLPCLPLLGLTHRLPQKRPRRKLPLARAGWDWSDADLAASQLNFKLGDLVRVVQV